MKKVYEPEDVNQLPETSEVVPHIEITEGIRMHVYSDGIAFGIIYPQDPQFSEMLSFEKLREILISRVEK